MKDNKIIACKRKQKKVIGSMKNETGGKAITKSAATKPKPQRYKVQKR